MRDTIVQLQKLMDQKGIDAWMVNSSDFHDSEYSSDHWHTRSFLTGFTGSAGVVVVTKTAAALWVDSRYFVQAGKQLQGSGITLMKMGVKGVPTVVEYLKKELPEGGCFGFDGRTVSEKNFREYQNALKEKNIRFSLFDDLGGDIWSERPAMPCSEAWILDPAQYSGKTAAEKLAEVRARMAAAGADVHLVTSLDDIAWLYNVRGNDVACNPVILSYAVVTTEKAYWFVQAAAVTEAVRADLEAQGVEIMEYEAVGDYLAALSEGHTLMADLGRVSCGINGRIPAHVDVINAMNPETVLKAMKNETEQANIRKAHIKDGVAMVHFLYWLKQNVGKIPMTELSCAAYLDGERAKQEGFIELSFNTISAYQSNAAMCHYSPTKESDAKVEAEGFLLVDSGGQYKDGTTDITRTIVVGPITEKQKLHYTLVLKGHIQLAMAKFPYGTTGPSLDMYARAPMWQYGIDFGHGTGHGVGFVLNVHEGPQRIAWNPSLNHIVMEEGMLTSNEPGYYLEGEYGIRTENLVLCHTWKEDDTGKQLMELETVTLAPIDKEAIDVSLLTKAELDWLNVYHARVYETLCPLLTEEAEQAWLKDACAPLDSSRSNA